MFHRGKSQRRQLWAVRALSIRLRLSAVFGCLVLLMLLGSLLPLWHFAQIRRREKAVSLVEQRMTAIFRLNNKLLTFMSQLHRLADKEQGRDFAVEANRLLATFESESGNSRAILEELEPQTEREAVLSGSLAGMLEALPERVAAFIAFARARDWVALHARLANEVDETDEVVTALMRNIDGDLLNARKNVSDDIRLAQLRATHSLVVTGLVSLVTAAVLALAMTRSITRPLAALDRGARALARGQFGYQIPVAGNDELADLAKVFNRTSEELADLYSQVRNSEVRFRSLIENGADLIMVVDASGDLSYCSPSCHHVLGYDSETLTGRPIWDLLCEEDFQAARAMFVPAAVGAGEAKSFELSFRRRDGSSRRLEGVVRNLIADLKIAGLVINARDVSTRRLAEQAVKRSEKQLRLITDALPVLVSYIDPERRYRFANRRHEDWFSISREQMVGKDVSEVIGLAACQSIQDCMDKALHGEHASNEAVFHFEDGSERYVRATMIPDTDDLGEVRGIVSLFEDVTADRQAEGALRLSEARERSRAAEFEAIMDASPIALFVAHDTECRRVTGSRLTYELWGLPLGANFSNLAGDREGVARFRSARNGVESEALPSDFPLRTCARSGVPVQNYEFDVVFDDGGTRRLFGNSFPLLDETGGPRGAVAGFLDVTERRRMDERLRQAQKAESIGLLAGGIAHDFNNILTAVNGNISFALDNLGPDCAMRNYLEVAMQSVQRAAGLTRQLLAYAGKGAFVREPVIASEVAKNAVQLLGATVSKKIELQTELAEAVSPITMDPSQLEQVLMNLILNGAEAIGEGPGAVTVRTGGDESCVSIEVEDTGCGIDEATQKRMFDPFFTTKFVGRGLGLAAVQGIVQSLNGEIAVDSVVGRGTRIRVTLPVDKAPSIEPSAIRLQLSVKS
jgi:PAS domain S-box-containing protein